MCKRPFFAALYVIAQVGGNGHKDWTLNTNIYPSNAGVMEV